MCIWNIHKNADSNYICIQSFISSFILSTNVYGMTDMTLYHKIEIMKKVDIVYPQDVHSLAEKTSMLCKCNSHVVIPQLNAFHSSGCS